MNAMAQTRHPIGPGEPFLLDDPPRSRARLLLSQVLSHYCAAFFGISSEEIGRAFMDPDGHDDGERGQVAWAVALIGGFILDGRLRTYARPLGGGDCTAISTNAWEMDAHGHRFARSSYDPARPYDPSAEPTHWIFMDADDAEGLVMAACRDGTNIWQEREAALAAAGTAGTASASVDAEPHWADEDADPSRPQPGRRYIRRKEVEVRTGMSRSTIYSKIKTGDFPDCQRLGKRMSVWIEADVDAWLAIPR